MSSDYFMDIQIQATTSEDLWDSLPNEYKERFEIKRIEVVKIKGEEAKKVYKRDDKWNELHKATIEAYRARTEREEQIRTNLR